MSREFWKYFFVAVGTISSVVTLVSFVFQLHNPSCLVVFFYILGVIVLSSAFAIWQTWRKKAIKLKISNNLTINVIEGDLFSFAQDDNYVVIPVNEYFDTIVDEKVINKGSLHGQFILKYYADNPAKLHDEIDDYLATQQIEGIIAPRDQSEGYEKKYPLGTCAIIKHNHTNFVLLALTHFDDEDHAYVELSEFGRSISRMCHFLSDKVGTTPVFMPLMGMGLSRLNQSAQFILKYTLDTIVGIKDLAMVGGIHVVVFPPVAKTINLNEIKY
jgi:hypothetical protein